ncbi:hypothetical protein [Haloarcula onubensis]|uniref:Glycosyltransferase RgtA/B/C/D-like domain-containing protein n=1 Tax=Haloarcula onubensis TaxID=2950539 RepID=A0ABU2FPF7_9EURY|nr:hypothetical protein [Halomicroarcula sp. S3CR25-11]MDS0282645.1 hypothetical protein [Halomicroarcula sp. S3CR25-11]
MNVQRTLDRWLPTRLDTGAAVLGLCLAALMFPLRLFASQVYIETIPVVLGTACLLYLAAGVRDDRAATGLPTLSRDVRRLLPILVTVCASALVVVAVEHGERSLLFYDVAGVAGTLLLAQILFVDERSFDRTRVLWQVVLLAAVVRLSALYVTPGLVGIDIWTHVTQLAHAVQTSGSVEAIADNKHYTSPLYHLLVAATALLADVPLRLGLYLSLGVAMPVALLAVYSSASLLVEPRWAALAAALFSLGDYVIEWGIHLIPTSMGLLFFLAVLYWLLRVMRTGYGRREFGLLVLFSAAVILTHQVSSFIMLVVLTAGLLAYLVLNHSLFDRSPLEPDVFRPRNPLNIAGLLAFDAGFITFLWSFTPYNGNSFLVTVLSYLEETLVSSAGVLNLAGQSSGGGGGAAAQSVTLAQTLSTYVDTVGFLLLLFGAFVGCLYVVNRHRAQQSAFTLLAASAVMLVFVLGLPLFGIRNFIPQRWFAFLYAPLALLSAIGIRYLATELDRRLLTAVALVFVLVFPSAMVMSSHGTVDNPVFDDQSAALAYSEAEIDAAHTIGRMTGSPGGDDLRPDQVLYTDHPYQTLFTRTGSYPADTARINDTELVAHDVTVYRTEQTTSATYFLNRNDVGESRNVPEDRICRSNQAVLYTNADVELCVEPPATDTPVG